MKKILFALLIGLLLNACTTPAPTPEPTATPIPTPPPNTSNLGPGSHEILAGYKVAGTFNIVDQSSLGTRCWAVEFLSNGWITIVAPCGATLHGPETRMGEIVKELRNLAKDATALKAKAKDRWYVPNPNKAGDLEKLRERTLLREFEEYRESKQKRLKVFRLEAVRAGFKKAWQERDYATIIAVAAKIPEKILQEDPKLLMWFDQALTRMGVDA